MNSNTLEENLRQFTGTENYHRYSALFRTFVLTDGAKYLAEEAGAYWLMDAIASHRASYKNEGFVAAKLSKATASNGWVLRLEDGNDGLLADQLIEYSDFPLDEITLYVIPQDTGNQILHVIMLPSEY